MLALISLVTLFLSRPDEPPAEPRPDFSGERALETVKELCGRGQRHYDAPERAAAIDALRGLLEKSVDQTALQRFEATEKASGRRVELTNIIGRLQPKATRRVLLGSHFDTRSWAEEDADPARREQPIQGANDGTSGVAVLIELARVLKAQGESELGVDFVLFDGEEFGRPDSDDYFQGSKYFVRMLKSLYPRSRPEWALIVDMVGDCDQGFLPETSSVKRAPRLVFKLWEAAERLGYGEFFRENGTIEISDDHSALQEAGIQAALLIDSEYPPWHTHGDTVDKVCANSLERVGKVILEVLRQHEEGIPNG